MCTALIRFYEVAYTNILAQCNNNIQLIAAEKHVYTLHAQAQISNINRTGIIALHLCGFQ